MKLILAIITSFFLLTSCEKSTPFHLEKSYLHNDCSITVKIIPYINGAKVDSLIAEILPGTKHYLGESSEPGEGENGTGGFLNNYNLTDSTLFVFNNQDTIVHLSSWVTSSRIKQYSIPTNQDKSYYSVYSFTERYYEGKATYVNIHSITEEDYNYAKE